MGIQCTWIIANRCCSSVTKSCPTLCDPRDYSTPGFPVLHHLPEFAQIHVHWVDDAIQSPLSPPPPPALSLSQRQGLFQLAGSSHQVAKVLELQLQHSPSNEYSGLISFRVDWFDLLAVQGTLSLKSLLQHHNSKASVLLVIACQLSFSHCVVSSRFVDSKFPWVKQYKRKGKASLCLNKIIFFFGM